MTLKNLLCSSAIAALSLGSAHAATAVNIVGSGSSLAAPTYDALFAAYTKSVPTTTFYYAGIGSGGGQSAFLTNSQAVILSKITPTTITYGTISGTAVDFGASDAFLSSAQLSGYTLAGADGPIIQIPTIGTPITIPYNETKQTSTLTLTDAQLCGVLSGSVTDWHALNSAIPSGTTISVVYRTDGSGTTFLLTQHLKAVCTGSNSKFTGTLAATQTFASLFANNTPPSTFIGASGSGGVEKVLLTTANSIGYLSPDFTSIAPKSSNPSSLLVADLVNATSKVATAPTVANTILALTNPGTGSTNPTPPKTMALAENQLNWVPALPLVNKGYPIVGYTTLDLSTCYANKTVGTELINFLTQTYKTQADLTLIENNGFVPLSNSGAATFVTAVSNDFLTNGSKFNLNIGNTTVCAGKAGR